MRVRPGSRVEYIIYYDTLWIYVVVSWGAGGGHARRANTCSGGMKYKGRMTKNALKFEPMNPLVALPLRGVRVVYEPSVYGGDGTEVRRNIVLEVAQDTLRRIRGHEASIDPSRLCSCIRKDNLRCKIGMDKVRVFDQTDALVAPQVIWRDLRVNVVVLVKGRWSTKTQSGLSMEVMDVQLTPDTPPRCPFPSLFDTEGSPEVVRAH